MEYILICLRVENKSFCCVLLIISAVEDKFLEQEQNKIANKIIFIYTEIFANFSKGLSIFKAEKTANSFDHHEKVYWVLHQQSDSKFAIHDW